MVNVREIYEFIDAVAPFSTALPYDNSGLLAGDPLRRVSKVLLTLDITHSVVEEAEKNGAELILSHHPVIFRPVKKVTAGQAVYSLVQKGICAICAHTNLDAADGGVSDVLAGVLQLENVEPFSWEEEQNVGRVGYLRCMQPVQDFASYTKTLLHAGCVRYVEGGCPVNRVAVIGGAGGSYIEAAVRCEADTLVTGEMKYHDFLDAKQAGLNVVTAGHYATEVVVLPVLKEKLQKAFDGLDVVISKENTELPLVAM